MIEASIRPSSLCAATRTTTHVAQIRPVSEVVAQTRPTAVVVTVTRVTEIAVVRI